MYEIGPDQPCGVGLGEAMNSFAQQPPNGHAIHPAILYAVLMAHVHKRKEVSRKRAADYLLAHLDKYRAISRERYRASSAKWKRRNPGLGCRHPHRYIPRYHFCSDCGARCQARKMHHRRKADIFLCSDCLRLLIKAKLTTERMEKRGSQLQAETTSPDFSAIDAPFLRNELHKAMNGGLEPR